jgi:hypothetical protein
MFADRHLEARSIKTVYMINDEITSQLAVPNLLTKRLVTIPDTIDQIRSLPFLIMQDIDIVSIPRIFALNAIHDDPETVSPYFVGVGDPIIGTCGGSSNMAMADATSDAIDPRTLGCQLPLIPETAAEINDIKTLFAPNWETVLEGAYATKKHFQELNDSGVLKRATLIVIATHGLAPGELQIFSDPMRPAQQDHFGIPLVGNAASDFARKYTTMPKEQAEALKGSLLYNYFSRDVPDKRFTFAPGLVFSYPENDNRDEIDPANDGFLSSPEIASLDLSTDVVILSACNTAAQENDQSKAIFSGLSRAFLAAGAKSVVATQWSVASGRPKRSRQGQSIECWPPRIQTWRMHFARP